MSLTAIFKPFGYKLKKSHLVLLIGLISPFNLFINSNNLIIENLKIMSPLPIVFSMRPSKNLAKAESRYKNYSFDFYRNSEDFITKSFDKRYYKSLGGTHKYKLFHFVSLNNKKYIEDPTNEHFYKKIFCLYPNIRNAFKIEFEVSRVRIRNNQQVFHDIKCID